MSDLSETLFEEGVEFYEQEKFEEAENKFLEALKLNPQAEEIMYNLALVYFETNRYGLCRRLVDAITEIDCDELLDELEKVEADFEYELPDSIPDACEECDHLNINSVIKDDFGFCAFYNIKVAFSSSCYARQLADEGKVTADQVEQRYNQQYKKIALELNESLKDEYLPELYICDFCGAENKLSETNRLNKQFTCDKCSRVVDVKQAINELNTEMRAKSDVELIKTLLHPEDYRVDFILASKKELIRRNIDLIENNDLFSLLKELQRQRLRG